MGNNMWPFRGTKDVTRSSAMLTISDFAYLLCSAHHRFEHAVLVFGKSQLLTHCVDEQLPHIHALLTHAKAFNKMNRRRYIPQRMLELTITHRLSHKFAIFMIILRVIIVSLKRVLYPMRQLRKVVPRFEIVFYIRRHISDKRTHVHVLICKMIYRSMHTLVQNCPMGCNRVRKYI